MPLERTAIGSPISGAVVKHTPTRKNNKLRALSAMASVGSQLFKAKADAQEAQAVMAAQNDVINNEINPDKMEHQAAYAWTVAENDALATYNQTADRINNGEYNSVDPNDFQKELQKKHNEYYKKWDKSNYAEKAVSSYNKFMLANQARLTSAQAGKYRLFQKNAQGQALSVRITGMAEKGNYKMKDYEDEIASPKYSLMDAATRLDTVLTGIGKYAVRTGNTTFLTELDKKYGLSSDPKFYRHYEGLLKAANRKSLSIDSAAVLKEMEVVQSFIDQGTLQNVSYGPLSKLLTTSGAQVFPPKKWKTLLDQSKVNFLNRQAEARNVVGLATGEDLSYLKQSSFDATCEKVFARLDIPDAKGKTLTTAEKYQKMGEILGQQTKIYKPLQDRAELFNRCLLLINNEPNPIAMSRFEELASLEAGMSKYTNGKALFAKYLGGANGSNSKAYANYLEMEAALKANFNSATGTKEKAWIAAAVSIEQRKKTTAHTDLVESLSTDAKKVSADLVEKLWDSKTSIFSGWLSTDAPDKMERVRWNIAKRYDDLRAEGRPIEIAKKAAQMYGESQVVKWGEQLMDTHGIDMGTLLGTPDPDGAWDTLLDDPEYNAKLKELFGIPIEDFTLGGWWPKGEYGKYRTVEKQKKWEESRKEEPQVLLNNQIHKYLDIEHDSSGDNRGSLVFENDKGETFKIPLRDIGALQNAKLQGIEEIARLPRLYNPSFLSTDAGRKWHDKQADQNSEFATEILGTDRAKFRTNYTPLAYAKLSEMEQTRVRKQFYKDAYSGALGHIQLMAEYMGLKRRFREKNREEALIFDIPARPGTGVNATSEVNATSGVNDEAAKKLIKQHEGLNLTAYKDAGGMSVGYGHAITKGEKLKGTITQEKANELFDADYAKAKKAAEKNFPNFNTVSPNRQSAITNLTFNMGDDWYKNFPKFTKAFVEGDYNTAADELENSKWASQVGENRSRTIIKLIREG